MKNYRDTTDGANTWNINLYRLETTARSIIATRNNVPIDFNEFDDIVQEIRTTTDNALVLRLELGSGISIDSETSNKIDFDYTPLRTGIKTGDYVHDVFFIRNGDRLPWIKRSRFTINQNVTEVDE